MKSKIIIWFMPLVISLFTGCGSDAKTVKTPPIEKQEIQYSHDIVAKATGVIDTKVISAGEIVTFSYRDSTKEIRGIEWRDKSGKLLSKDRKFNRLFEQEGEYTTVVTVTTKQGEVTTDTILVKVNRKEETEATPNKVPVVKAKVSSSDVIEGTKVYFEDDGSFDPDGTIVKYEWRDMDGILLSETKNLDRVMHYWPQYDFNNDGTTRYVKTLFVTDDKGAVSSKDFVIIVRKKPTPNKLPTVDAGESQIVTQAIEVTFTAMASDEDGTIESYSWKEGDVVLATTASFSKSDFAKGIHILIVTVTDDKGGKNSDTVVVVVNEASATNQPPTTLSQTITMDEDSTKLIILSGTDADGDLLSHMLVTLPSHGALSGTVPNLTYSPNPNYHGSDSFTYKVSDGKADSNLATITLTINDIPEPNQKPTALPQAVAVAKNSSIAITLTGSDVDGDTLTYIMDANPTHGTVALVGNVATYTPTVGYGGIDNFTFKTNDGQDNSTSATVSIAVNYVNNIPTVDAGADVTIIEGDSYLPTPSSNDIDGAIVSTIWREGDVILTFPKTDFSVGTHLLTITVTDNNEAAATDMLTVTVNATPATCKLLHKTGQITIYYNNDDGDYQKGAIRSYTRDDVNGIVTDNVTNLMWQDTEPVQKRWVTLANFEARHYMDTSDDTAMTYCANLTLGAHGDWRLPSIEELYYLVDLGQFNPAIDPVFQNQAVGESFYWSSTSGANPDYRKKVAWIIEFIGGYDGTRSKEYYGYVRCVRDND